MSKSLIQSFLSSTLHGKLSVYECRVFVRIVERAQGIIRSAIASDGFSALRGSLSADGESLHMVFPLSDFLPLGGVSRSHYSELKQSLLKMISRIVQYEALDSAGHRLWKAATLIEHPVIDEVRNVVSFDCQRWLMNYILDFSSGYSCYSLENALKIKNPNTLRLYMLMASQKGSVSFKITYLRNMLGCEHLYARDGDFIRRCIISASKDLERLGINGFDCEVVQLAGKTSKINRVVLKPVKREEVSASAVAARLPVSQMGCKALRSYLARIGFSSRELGGNKVIINEFSRVDNWQNRLDDIVERAMRKGKNHGYIINGMKKEFAAWKKSMETERRMSVNDNNNSHRSLGSLVSSVARSLSVEKRF